ncbi:MAG: two-component regulator propeller domain-containing protein [Pyrinomonadaceae bacterium]
MGTSFFRPIALAAVIAFLSICIFGNRLPVKLYSSADGLGSGFVDYIYRDSRGFMWFCTRDGLSRFDGSRFITFRIGDENAPPGIENIYETREGTYYVTTTGGTYKFEPDDLTTPLFGVAKLNATLVSGWRGDLLQDRNGVFWMGSGSLFRREIRDGKDEWVAVDLGIPPVPGTTFVIYDLAETPDGSLWVHNTWGLLRMLPDGRKVNYPHGRYVTAGATAMMADRPGRIWLTRGGELLALKPEAIDQIQGSGPLIERDLSPTETVPVEVGRLLKMPSAGGQVIKYVNPELIGKWVTKKLFQSSDGDIWISAENTLLHIADGVVELLTDAQGLPTVMARMAEDEAGNLWIGGHAGLARLDRNGLVSYGKEDGLTSSRFFSANEGPDGRMYFAQLGFYWSAFDGERFETAHPDIPENSSFLWTSRFGYLSSLRELWMLTAEGLYRFADGTDLKSLNGRSPTVKYTTADGLRSNSFFHIFEDTNGDIWVSTRGSGGEGHGVARLRKGESRFVHFTQAEGFPPGKSAASYARDPYGNIWLGFYEGGMARFDGDRFTVFSSNDGLPANGHIADLHVDRKGVLWLASSIEGLLKVADPGAATPVFERVTIDAGNVSSNIRTLTEDGFGRLYLGTARGVVRYSPETGFVKHFTVNDGLAADFVVDSHCSRNGDVWFVTNDGVSRLTPQPDERSAPPRVLIGAVRIGDQVQPISNLGTSRFERGELGYRENDLQFDFVGLDFRAGESLRFQYRLIGATDQWSQPSDLPTVAFANLPPGSYNFQVRAINSEGVSSDVPAEVTFTIVPPVWERWWFLLLVAVALGLLIYSFYRYRTAKLLEINAALKEARRAEERLRRSREERLMELERVRSRIATDLHDDIGASLTQIAILSEVAQTRAGNGGGAASEPLEKITEVSNELVGTMSDIVWSINPGKDHLSDLTQRMRRFASDVLAPRGIAARFAIPGDGDAIIVSSNIRREVFLVFKEAINNVAKHSGARLVEVTLEINAAEIFLVISDDGVGSHLDRLAGEPLEVPVSSDGSSGNGIANMRKRAAEMDGTFEILSEVGKGTTIKLRLPRELAFDDSIIPNRPVNLN